MNDFVNTSFVITGGSSGLGEACVGRLSQLGACGVIADVAPPGEPPLHSVARNFTYHPTDVTREADVGRAIAAAKSLGSLRGAILCAGILGAEKIVGRDTVASLEAFRRVIEVNLIGTFNVLRLAAEAMRDNEPNLQGERGVIITTSSIAAFEGQIGQAAYAASKGGVAALTLPAARELGRYGIRVVSIAPGVFATPMMEQTTPAVRESLAAQVPFPPRFGRPDEFAALAVHILENPMLNGTVLRLDGGLRMAAR